MHKFLISLCHEQPFSVVSVKRASMLKVIQGLMSYLSIINDVFICTVHAVALIIHKQIKLLNNKLTLYIHLKDVRNCLYTILI